MKKYFFFPLLIIAFVSVSVKAQQQVISIWPGVAPGSENWTQKEIEYLNDQKQLMVRNIVSPTLVVYLPDPAINTGTAVIVAPGGGFRFLSWQTEGTDVAQWLAANGVVAFVLRYRLINTGTTQEEFQKAMFALFKEISAANNPEDEGKPEGNILSNGIMKEGYDIALQDGQQATRFIRKHFSEWGIKPDRIGIMGFSAGGMVTLGCSMHFDKESRPDFAAAIYAPWIGGIVPSDAPPVFLLVSGDDRIASSSSVQTYNFWKDAGKDSELHIYSKGGHGFGMQKRGLPSDSWIERFHDWMKVQGLM